ncbi:hypothetical protein Tco_1224938, partial [Tanacetum coccineum]
MDWYTKNTLWVYRTRGDDEEVITDDESYNLGDGNLIEQNESAQIFRIDTDIFHFETPLFEAFKEFNYLLKIDVDVLTNDIPGFKTYDEYKDAWIYEWKKDIQWVANMPWLGYGPWMEPSDNIEHICKPFRFKNGHFMWPTCNWKKEKYCNGGDLPGVIRSGDVIYFERTSNDYETKKNEGWFDEHELMDDDDDDIGDLEDYLIQKDHSYYVNKEEETSKERRCKLHGIPYVKPPTCKSDKFEVVKYSFGQAEEYVAIKEYKYDIQVSIRLNIEQRVKVDQKARILELKRRNYEDTVLTTNTPYPSRKIRRFRKKYRLNLEMIYRQRDKTIIALINM